MSEKQDSDILKLAKGSGISLLGNVTGKSLLFLSHVLIARILGPKAFGLYVLGLVSIKATELIARLGLDIGAMRYASICHRNSPERVKGTLISATSISFLSGILFAVALAFLADFVSVTVFHEPELKGIITIFSFCIPFMASMMTVATSTQGFHTTKYSVYIRDIIQPLANITFIVILFSFSTGLKEAIYAFVLSHILALMSGIYIVTSRYRLYFKRDIKATYNLKELLSYSAPIFASAFLMFLILWVDVIMLGIFKSSASVGIYRAACQIPLFMVIILQASNSIYAPVSAELFRNEKRERLNQVFKTTTKWVFYLTLPIALVLLSSAKEVMLIFGSQFVSPGATVLMILTVAQLINCCTGGVGYTLCMAGKQNIELTNSALIVCINIGLNVFLIPRYGEIGAAVATGVAIISINIIRLIEVYVLYKIHPYDKKFLSGLLAACICLMLLVLISFLDLRSTLLTLTCNSAIVVVTFLAVLKFGGISQESSQLINAFKKKMLFSHSKEKS